MCTRKVLRLRGCGHLFALLVLAFPSEWDPVPAPDPGSHSRLRLPQLVHMCPLTLSSIPPSPGRVGKVKSKLLHGMTSRSSVSHQEVDAEGSWVTAKISRLNIDRRRRQYHGEVLFQPITRSLSTSGPPKAGQLVQGE